MLMTSRFMIKQLQLMHRVSLMQLQVHKLLEGGARSRKKRKELKEHIEKAKHVYDVAFETVAK